MQEHPVSEDWMADGRIGSNFAAGGPVVGQVFGPVVV
jgi:hypothetical protein